MASDAIRRRAGVQAAATRAARVRREKLLLGAGILALAGLLALEGPKTLNSLEGKSSAPSSAMSTNTTGSPTAKAPAPTSLKALSKLQAKDPFAQQLAGSGTQSPGATSLTPPAVRDSHFVQKDPFVQQVGAPAVSSVAVVTPVAAPKVAPVRPLSSVGSGIIVIVASVPVGRGQAVAEKAATQAQAKGVKAVHVALSSAYKTLRTGYFAVYTGPYSTLAAAVKELASVRRLGFVSAYTRRLGH
jgi:hypothetical protein